jgi:tetratricopeptide (TPR) repeat protein
MKLLPGRQKTLLASLLVAASTFVLYGGALKNDFIGWDDEFYVLANPYITPLSGGTLWGMFSNFHFKSWTPLTLLSHAIDYSIWGLDPRGHHLTNMVIHSLNGVWILFLSLALLKRYRSLPEAGDAGGKAPQWETALIAGSVASALLFAWHPLRVEAVACASSRKDLLSTFLVVPSLLLYILYADRRGASGAWREYSGSVVLFGLSLLAKGSVMTMAGILLIVDMMTGSAGGGRGRWMRLLLEKIPYLLLGLAAAYVAFVASEGGGDMAQVLRAKSEYSSLELGLYNCAFYLIKTLWPAELAELYTYPKWGGFLPVACVGPAVTILAALLWRKGVRSFLYAWGAYIIALLPMAGFVASSIQVLANRYAYLAAVPFCMLFGGGVMRMWGDARLSHRRWRRPALIVSASLVLAALAVRTWIHVGDWRDAETVWRHTIVVSPGHALAHNELGLALLEKKDFAGAVASFKRSVELYPEFSQAMCNMGGAYVSMGDSTNAERILRQALALSPDDYATYTNLGNVRLIERRYAEAAGYFRQSLAMNPRAAITTYDLGYANMLMGNPGEALALLRRAVRLNPNYRDAYFLMGEILSRQKDGSEDALRAYRRAARLGHEQSQRILAARGIDW